MNNFPAIALYDTTLRDGAQTEGLSLSVEDKLQIAQHLDRLGIPFIEGGWPGANPKDTEFFERLKAQPLSQAQVVPFCMTRRPGGNANIESMFAPILAASTTWVTLVGKSWDLHVTESLRTSLPENLAMIQDSVSFFAQRDRLIIYDAEHWFDGYTHNPDYALQTLEVALQAGAEWLVLCDTNGGSLPGQISTAIAAIKNRFGNVPLGIHTHNDAGLAVGNAIAAVEAGVTMVQGTINGYGERCGNANLCTLIPNLQIKMQRPCIRADQLSQLSQISRQVSEIVNLAPDDHAPYVGLSAFAHKGGMHVSAVERNPITYEHISPDLIGNNRRIVISEQSGLSNVLAKASSFGIDLNRDHPACKQILAKIKDLEQLGYQFEAAEASFDLLMRDAVGQRPHFFDLASFQVHCEPVAEQEAYALATVKIAVHGEERLTAAEGNGPVSALDTALRKALIDFYPAIANFHLTDYKVRILNGNAGTNAKTRVLIESTDGNQRWTTVGVSSNIIAASYQALVESIEYGLLNLKK
ncbi:MAG: citramalate synthase [Pseudanabaenaceae cyanobacterium bins.68]|nr:citramalate synthase [Pseudanabaenaceae cyanobacterium bins.68]